MPSFAVFLFIASWSLVQAVAAPAKTPADAAPAPISAPAPAPPLPSPSAVSSPPERLFSLSSSALTSDWGGLRPSLRDHGITFNGYLNNQYQAVVKGGRDTEGGRNAASMDAFVTLDLGKLGLAHDTDVLLHLQSNWGAGINARTAAIYEVNDDSDGDLGLHVAQFWYRRHFLDRRLSLTLGFLDFQTIVDRNAYANSEDKQFWNQTLDNNPLVPLNIGLGVTLSFRPVDWYTLVLGVADAQSVLYKPGFSTAFHDAAWFVGYLENAFAVTLPSKRGPLPGNYRIGTVYNPRVRAVFPAGRHDVRRDGDDYGFYIGLDQMLFRETPQSDQGLGVFGRFGYRTPETNRMARFWSAGVAYQGLLPSRGNDVLGFGFSLTRGSRLYRERVNDEFDNETVYEIYYAIQMTKWLVVTPDIQYLDNPGATNDLSHTLVAGLRTRVSF